MSSSLPAITEVGVTVQAHLLAFQKGDYMDFIERIFGISPDGGSGALEFFLFAIPIAGVIWLVRSRSRSRHRNRK